MISKKIIYISVAITTIAIFVAVSIFNNQNEICTFTVNDPFKNCDSDTTISYICPNNDVLFVTHFVSSGNLKLAGSSDNITTNEDLNVPTNEMLINRIDECYKPFENNNGEIYLIGDFYITVPCHKVPNADLITNEPGTYSPTNDQQALSSVNLWAKVFKNNEAMNNDAITFSLIKNYRNQISLSGDLILITENDYSYLCINNTPQCAAVVRLKVSYDMENYNVNDRYKLVFFAADHTEDNIDHSSEENDKDDCEVPDGVIFADLFKEKHIEIFENLTKESSKEARKRINTQNSLLPCFDISQDSIQRYYCIEQSGCHAADHLAIINLPKPCEAYTSIPHDNWGH